MIGGITEMKYSVGDKVYLFLSRNPDIFYCQVVEVNIKRSGVSYGVKILPHGTTIGDKSESVLFATLDQAKLGALMYYNIRVQTMADSAKRQVEREERAL